MTARFGKFGIFIKTRRSTLRDDYIKEAQKIIPDPNILINVVSRRVKQLKAGSEPTVNSLEKLELEDVALLEIIRGNISYELFSPRTDSVE